MKITVLGKAHDVYGAVPAGFHVVGMMLEQSLGDYGPGITNIEVTTAFQSGRSSPDRFPEHYEKHLRWIESLPAVKFFRKKALASISYLTSLDDGKIFRRRGPLSAEFFAKAYDEIAQQLHLLDGKIRPADQFDLARLHQDVERLRASLPKTDAALQDLAVDLRNARAARIAAMDPWDKLDIDWSEFHPRARELLNETFYWEEGDDAAPHGNDTGADAFADYRKWTRQHPGRPAHELATSLLRNWQFPEIDWTEATEDKVKAMIASNTFVVSVCDDTMIALAFGMIKIHGCCDATTRSLAIKAIERERLDCVLEHRGWEDAENRRSGLKLMEQCLLRTPETP